MNPPIRSRTLPRAVGPAGAGPWGVEHAAQERSAPEGGRQEGTGGLPASATNARSGGG